MDRSNTNQNHTPDNRLGYSDDDWFIGRLVGGFCIAAGVLGALTFGDWSGIPIGLFVLWQAWKLRGQRIE